MFNKIFKKRIFDILLPINLIILSIFVISYIFVNIFSYNFDAIFGEGEEHVVRVEGSEDWDLEYYDKKYETYDESSKNALITSKKIADEGIVLLRNDNKTLPLDEDSIVSPFGYSYSNPYYTGNGSGNVKSLVFINPQEALKRNFNINESIEFQTLNKSNHKVLNIQPGTSSSESFGGDNLIRYVKQDAYNGIEASCVDTTGIVFIGREGSENIDVKSDGYIDGTRHKLTLTNAEKEIIRYSNVNCKKTIVVLNVPSVFEVSSLYNDENLSADAILWIGFPGANGFESLSDILVGKINPSGRTVDIYPSNLLNHPSMDNFGDYQYSNCENKFVEYEEGIYVGYRYYETAHYLKETNKIDNFDYNEAVTYPFGHGLSYTNFKQRIVDFNENDKELYFKINVKNIGNLQGKDVIQLYFNPPFTSEDINLNVEKAAKNLIYFSKSTLLEPNEEEMIEINIKKEDLASYYYNFYNEDVKGAYILAKGTYNFYLSKDSHSEYEVVNWVNNESKYYDSIEHIRQSDKDAQSILNDDGTYENTAKVKLIDENLDYEYAKNKFEELNEYMNQQNVTRLTRQNWSTTQPSIPIHSDSILNDKYLKMLSDMTNFDYKTNPELGNVETSKIYDDSQIVYSDKGLVLSSLRGKSYYDKSWNELLNQINFKSFDTLNDLRDLLIFGGFNTSKVTDINKLATKDYDGPQGFVFPYSEIKKERIAYPSEVVLGSTWNKDMAKEFGDSISQEALTTGINGIYAPGVNIHRSPFGGRNHEYFSEDPHLSGYLAKEITEAAANNGLITYLKHFILNEQETNRKDLLVWVDEQALREIYLKPFEIVIKNSMFDINYIEDLEGNMNNKKMRASLALMSSFNCIGAIPSSSCYSLLTEILRNEWGFEGMVISDYETNVDYDAMIRSGNDFYLWSNDRIEVKKDLNAYIKDIDSNTSKNIIKKAVKNISYAVVNSGAYNFVAPGDIVYKDIAPRNYFYSYVYNGFILTLFFIIDIYLISYGIYKIIVHFNMQNS